MNLDNEYQFFPFPLEKRKCISKKLMLTNPDRIPVIVIFDKNILSNITTLKNIKILLDRRSTLGSIINIIREKLQGTNIHKKSLFIMCNNYVISLMEEAQIVYNKYCNEDGFLYLNCFLENTFG